MVYRSEDMESQREITVKFLNNENENFKNPKIFKNIYETF